MAGRSTRKKMQYQVTKILEDLDSILNHLKYIDELADGNNERVTEHMPRLVTIVDGMQNTFTMFRQEL